MKLALDTTVRAISLTARIENQPREQWSIHETIWSFVFQAHQYGLNSDHENSKMYFIESQGVLPKLVSELVSATALESVHKPEFSEFRISLGSEYQSDYSDNSFIRHVVHVEGTGHHSRVEFDASPFKTEFRTNKVMANIVNDLLTIVSHNKEFFKWP